MPGQLVAAPRGGCKRRPRAAAALPSFRVLKKTLLKLGYIVLIR